MNGLLKLVDFDVVAYATRLTSDMLPTVVPPVFRMRGDSERFFVPPFRLSGEWLVGATEISGAEYRGLCDDARMTPLPAALRAEPDHELWVGLDKAVTYAPHGEIDRKRRTEAMRFVAAAQQSLREGDQAAALRHTNCAASADDRIVEPCAIKAALCRVEKDWAASRVMEELVGDMITADDFECLVERYVGLWNAKLPAPAVVNRPESPMRGMALRLHAKAA